MNTIKWSENEKTELRNTINGNVSTKSEHACGQFKTETDSEFNTRMEILNVLDCMKDALEENALSPLLLCRVLRKLRVLNNEICEDVNPH